MNPRINRTVLFIAANLAIALWGCTEKFGGKAEPPGDLIPRDTMVSIFVDLRLMDAVLNYEQRQGNRKLHEMKYQLHNSILEKYCISRDQFERSFDYYEDDIDVLDGIYAEAIGRLSRLKSEVDQE